MKVTCDTCEAQYNIDETKIPATGLAVKCSKCKHLFIVRPPEPTPTAVDATEIGELIENTADESYPESSSKEETQVKPAEEEPTPYWTLKRADGHTFTVQDASTLQRWIVENKALASDHLSMDGQTFVELGTLEEYKPFFNIVERNKEDQQKEAEAYEKTSADVSEPIAEPAEDMGEQTPEPVEEPVVEEEKPHKQTMDMLAHDYEQAQAEAEKAEQEELSAPIEENTEEAEPEPEKPVQETYNFEELAGVNNIENKVEEPAISATNDANGNEIATQVATPPVKNETAETLPVEETKQDVADDTVANEQSEDKVMGTPASLENMESENWSASSEDFSEWDDVADNDDEFSGKGRALKAIIALIVLLAIAAGATYFVKPEIITNLLGSGYSKAEMKILENSRNDINQYTITSLDKAEAALKNLLKRNDSMLEAVNMLSEINTSKAELYQQDVVSLEAMQLDTNTKAREAIIALEQSKRKTPELKLKLAEAIKAQDIMNKKVVAATEKFNSAKKSAFNFAEQANNKHPEAFLTLRTLAAYYAMGGERGKANDFLQKAQKKNAEDAMAITIKGYLYALDKSLSKEAHETLQMAALKDPSIIKARFREAVLYAEENNTDAARKLLNEILGTHPDHAPSRIMLEKLPSAQQKEKKTESATKKADKKKVKKPKAEAQTYDSLLKSANRLRRTDRTQKALALYKKATRLKSTADVLSGIGYCYLDLENFQGALDNFKKALGKNKKHEASLIGIASTYELLGSKANAIKYYKRYLKHYPKGEDARAAQNTLKRLKD